MEDYFSITIQNVGLQVLETVHIIRTTKNFETIKGRYKLLIDRIDTLRKVEINRLFSTDINSSIGTYKTMYHDRTLSDFELSSVLKPNDFDTQNFYCNALVSCTKRYVEEQINEISGLKNENAKIKRRAKFIESINSSKEELKDKCSTISSFLTALNSIEALSTALN